MSTHPIGATVLGYPRIGRRRELKRALEAYWKGTADLAALEQVSAEVRADALRTLSAAGLTTVPVNTFSWYDQVLDTAILLGAIPSRFGAVAGTGADAEARAQTYFALARGTETEPPLEMTKWFDTNYHYLVPEIGAETTFSLDAAKPLAEFAEAQEAGLDARPVIVGPYTFLALAKAATETDPAPLTRLEELTEVYAQLLDELAAAGVTSVQLDEPAAVRDLEPAEVEALQATYARLASVPNRPKILVATYFANPVESLPALATSGVEAISVDLTSGITPQEAAAAIGGADVTLVLGAVDGRNIWRTDLATVGATLDEWKAAHSDVAVSSSSSLLHVPYDTSVETDLDPELVATLAFADEKLDEVVALSRALDAGSAAEGDYPAVAPIPGRGIVSVIDRVAKVSDADRNRAERAERRVAQAEKLGLPVLPTTTIGSFPQTGEVRKARAAHRAGTLDDAGYTDRMKAEIQHVIDFQEKVGLDVLVHGEPERNDMVQYFAELLDGFATTSLGWVQSYGSRCVRPPILFGDVSRPTPMTVPWTTYAQSLTDKPVKGMLTGPVTILAWSFVRDDQPLGVTADQVALALRDEVTDLEAAGTAIVQVDEPALRELLPLRTADQGAYLDWSVGSFRLATGGAATDTQVHTHLCYSEFGEVIAAIEGLDADVTSLEAARSGMEVLGDLSDRGFSGVGPGVYDIHSPRVPTVDEVSSLIDKAVAAVGPDRVWINPDCGLKTRGYAEIEPALIHTVQATTAARESLNAPAAV